jgi:acyl-CoA thioesterase II
MGSFADDVTVRSAGDGRYQATLDDSWNLMPLPQGGVVVALALRAASSELDDPRQGLRSCTTVFAGQVVPGELEVEVSVLRRGRSASQVQATVRNAGEAAGATVVAVFGSTRRGPTLVDLVPPAVPPPEACPSYRDSPPPGVEPYPALPFWSRVEARVGRGHARWEQWVPEHSDVVTWLRFDDAPRLADGSLDPLGVVALADRMPGSIGELLGPGTDPWFAPSADLTVHLLEPCRTEWLLAHDRARWADDGWASVESTLWAEDGTLVAHASQMIIFTYLEQPAAG